ncbi:glycosyltransferase family 2 protein [Polymorphospora sp. NPDC051019]|uniref:glycosyltransferase family 2 protein n=1 Tax=Polymorphospora sp. NPDC051019 TaxID=3155725 RepID=UPI0034182B49
MTALHDRLATPAPATPPPARRRRTTPPVVPVDPALPQPPSRREKAAYRHRRLPYLMVASAVSFTALTVSQVLFVRMSPWLLLLLPLMAFTIAYYLVSLCVNLFTPDFDLDRHRRLVASWAPDEHPPVDVFLPVCGEAIDVLRNTWEHVAAMARHYPGPVHVYVLDDSATAEREAMALGFGFVYQRRPNRGWYKKAGNMRYAYQRTMGDFILVLDADFTPRHDLLDELMPYFDAYPDVGIVQSPQYFRVHQDQGWLERGAGAVQELFYRSVQVSRQHHEAAICVGSCAVYRRTALDAIGGSTLIEHSEDVHTGFDMRRRGWRLRYVPVPLATGLCPADVNSFFTQQYRWCAGSMSLLGSTKFWNTRMPVRQRLSYLSGFFYYLHTALFTFVGPLIPILMLLVFPQYVKLSNYLLIAPSLVYNVVVFPSWHRCAYGFEAWTTKMIYGWSHAFAVWDLLRGQSMGWQPTGGTARKNRTGRLWTGMAVWTAGSGIVWTLAAAYQMVHTDLAAFAPAFLGGVFFLTIAMQALLVDPAKDLPAGGSR